MELETALIQPLSWVVSCDRVILQNSINYAMKKKVCLGIGSKIAR